MAVAAVAVPAIANADIQVFLDAYYSDGLLTYSIELVDAAEGESYYTTVYENGNLVYKEQILDNRQSNSIPGLNGSLNHTVEVRAGELSLLVLKSVEIHGIPVWAELLTAEPSYDSIYFSVYLHGNDETAYVAVYDAATGDAIYQSSLTTGRLTETVTGLDDAHTYTIGIASETDSYLTADVTTLSPSVEIDHVTATENSIDYGVTIQGIQKPTSLRLYDPETSSDVYSTSLVNGYNEGTISDLSSNHTYILSVSSETSTYYSGEVTTLGSDVNLDSVTSVQNTIEYSVTVSGTITDAVLDLTDTETSTSVYSVALEQGINTAVITDLQYGHSYVLSASSGTKTYFTQEVATEGQALTIELESLTAEENTVSYSVLVTGNGAIATASLYSSDGGTVYSVDLSEGSNTATITDLEYDHEYTFVVSSGEEVFVSESVTTEEEIIPTTVTVDYIRAFGDTYQYRIIVEGNTDNPVLKATNGEEFVYATAALTVGVNEGSLEGENLGYHLECLVSIEGSETYYSEWIYTQEIYNYELTQDNKTIQYTVSIFSEWEDCEIFVIDDEDYTSEPAQLSDAFKFPAEDVVTSGTLDYDWILYGHSYTFGVLLNGGDVSSYGHVTMNYAEIEVTSSTGDGITCQVTIGIDDYQNATIALLDEGLEEPIQTMDATGLTGSYTFTEGVFGLHTYYVGVYYMDDLAEHVETTTTGEVTEVTVNVPPYANGNVIHYDFTVTGNSDDPWIFVSLDDDTVYSVSLLDSPSGTASSAQIDYNTTYTVKVLGENDHEYFNQTVTTDPFATATIEVTGQDIVVSFDWASTVTASDLTSLSLAVTRENTTVVAGPYSVSLSTDNYPITDLGFEQTYYVALVSTSDDYYIWEEFQTDEEVPYSIAWTDGYPTADGDSISYSFNITGNSGTLTLIITDDYDEKVYTETLSATTYSGRATELYPNTRYTVTVVDRLEVNISTGDFATVGVVTTINTVQANITFNITDYAGSTIGLYATNDCVDDDLIGDLITVGEGENEKTLYRDGLSVGTNYCIGLKTGGSLMMSKEVTTDAPVTATHFGLVTSGGEVSLSYEVEFNLEVSGTLKLMENDAVKDSAEITYDPDDPVVGTFDSWQRGHSYTLVFDTGTESYEIGDLEIPNYVTSFSAIPGPASISYEITVAASEDIQDGSLSVYLLEQGSGPGEYEIVESKTLNIGENSGSFTEVSLQSYHVVVNDTDLDEPSPFRYDGVSVTVSEKATPEIVAPTVLSNLVYTGEAQNLIAAGSNTTPGEFTYSTTESGTYTTAVPTGTIVGTYSVWYKFTPSNTSIYNSIDATLVADDISIGKANDSWSTTAGSASKTYGQPVQTSGTLKSGLTPTFSYYSDSGREYEYTISQLNALSAGSTVYVKVTTEGDENYNAFEDRTIEFTVKDVVTYSSRIDLNTKSDGTIQLNSSITINASNYSAFTCEIYDSADVYVRTAERFDVIFNVIIPNINYDSTYKVYIKESNKVVSSKIIIIPADTSNKPYWQDMS
ncbi:hypothetical protein AUP07_0762 [methanogenic archaeon mixed culture ISO4-G1]|nr:hypothetical protein AUP07_0762 [methanogenic archaeon mixed culture ISO4-G1]